MRRVRGSADRLYNP